VEAEMAVLDPKDHYAVLINTFEVEPEKADQLVELLQTATTQVMRTLDGVISASLHIIANKKRVVNYAGANAVWSRGESIR
jgi:hypothetical protein